MNEEIRSANFWKAQLQRIHLLQIFVVTCLRFIPTLKRPLKLHCGLTLDLLLKIDTKSKS